MSEHGTQLSDLSERVSRIEQAIRPEVNLTPRRRVSSLLCLAIVTAAILPALLAFGLPNHLYQIGFAVLIVGILYHREYLAPPRTVLDWATAFAHVVVFSICLKVFVGGGEPQPFHWFHLPDIEGGLTSFKITWKKVALSEFSVPLTVMQTFVLLLVIFTQLVGFEILASLLAFVLFLLSLPHLVTFNWTWVIPALVLAGLSVYLSHGVVESRELWTD